MTVLERILELRHERNWSEYRLAMEAEIPQTTISSWFKKSVNPSIPSIEKLCGAFNITMVQFFAYDDMAIDLTEKQKDLLNNWNKLPHKQQTIVLDLLKSM